MVSWISSKSAPSGLQDIRTDRILSNYLHLLNLRREQPAFHPLAYQQVLSNDPGVFALVRRSLDGKETILCLVNVTSEARQLSLGLDSWLPAHSTWQDLIGTQGYTAMHSGLLLI